MGSGLRAQPLELLVGEVCQQAGGLITHCTSCCCQSVFFPLSLRKANFLGKKPKTLACDSMFHILLCMWIFGVYVGSFKKEVFVRMWYSAARVKCGWLLNHFTGGEGHMFYPSLEVCSAFLSVYFVLFSEDFFFPSFP